ncbi:MAG: thioredoxin [Candidatus Firestonebacteria bacterium]|nr:thioredoxin [Candidatus Firestonebacteria bacterium]
MAGNNMINVTDANFDEEVLKSSQLVLLDFWAPWCGPCKMMAPLLEEILGEYKGKIKIGKMNVDENSAIPARFRIRSIPTIIFFKNGQKVNEIVGSVPKSQLVNAVNEKM